MSQCNTEYTRNAIWMTKSEQAGFTRALVEASRKALTPAERKTLKLFYDHWMQGRDMFLTATTFKLFRQMCTAHGIEITFKRKPRLRKGEKGTSLVYTWSLPQKAGAYWPSKGKIDVTEKNRLKQEYRIRILHEHMAKIGLRELDLGAHNEKITERQTKTVESLPEIGQRSNVLPFPTLEGGIDFGDCPTMWRTYPYGDDQRWTKIAA
jgi:hypothetical protein